MADVAAVQNKARLLQKSVNRIDGGFTVAITSGFAG